MPSTSPSRILRVVAETENHTHGARGLIHSMTLSLPTPDGPDRTVRRAGGRYSSVTSTPRQMGSAPGPFLPNAADLVALPRHRSQCGNRTAVRVDDGPVSDRAASPPAVGHSVAGELGEQS